MARETDGDHGPEQQAQRRESALEFPASTGRPTRHGHGASSISRLPGRTLAVARQSDLLIDVTNIYDREFRSRKLRFCKMRRCAKAAGAAFKKHAIAWSSRSKAHGQLILGRRFSPQHELSAQFDVVSSPLLHE